MSDNSKCPKRAATQTATAYETAARAALGPDYERAVACKLIGDVEGYVEICKARRWVTESYGT